MSETADIEEIKVREAFDLQAESFDNLYGSNKIIQYKRRRVREHLSKYLKQESKILELNCGTGEDATYLASQGHYVHATDHSEEMLKILREKTVLQQLTDRITNERISFTNLEHLFDRGPYDHIFSNFAGLNCTGNLQKVLSSFDHIIKPGGYVTLVLLPKFCLWESLLLFKGKWRTAFRRVTSGRSGSKAKIDDRKFRCWYYNPSFVINHLQNFKLVSIEGMCTIVPPSYIENFPEKYPHAFRFLLRWEDKLKTAWPFRNIGDYYIITLQKIKQDALQKDA